MERRAPTGKGVPTGRLFENIQTRRDARRAMAAHESKWAALLADAASAEPIAYEDVPWPPTTRGAVSSCAGRGAGRGETSSNVSKVRVALAPG